jgi:hypothetical protein
MSDIPDMQCDAQSVQQVTYLGLYYKAPLEFWFAAHDSSTKGLILIFLVFVV